MGADSTTSSALPSAAGVSSTRDVELVTTVGEIDHGAGRVRRAAGERTEGEHETSIFAGHADQEGMSPSLSAPDPQRRRGDPATKASKKSDIHDGAFYRRFEVRWSTVPGASAVTVP